MLSRREDLNIYVMSDKLEADKEVTLLLRVMDFNGKVLTKKSIKGEVPANASTLYYKEPYAGITTSPQNTFLLMTLKNKKGEVLSERNLITLTTQKIRSYRRPRSAIK